MNITVNSQQLAQELRLLNHVVPSKPALPILMNVLISATDTVQFYGTDLELGFRTACEATIIEQGSVTLPAKKLLDLVEQLPNADVQIVTDKTYVRVMSGAFKARLQTLSAEGFPVVPAVKGEPSPLSTTTLQSMIARVRYAISDKTKYMVNGALVTITPDVLALIATDGKRLSITTTPRESGAPLTTIIPAKTLDAIILLFSDETIEFSQDDRHLFFQTGDRLLVSRMVEGTFPAYQKIIPRDCDKRVTVDRASFAAALRRVGLVSDAKLAVYLSIEAQTLTITTSSVETGDAFERLNVSYEGAPLKVCVNWQYVLHFLDAATGITITCDFKDVTTPLLLSDGDAFINVVMLMRG